MSRKGRAPVRHIVSDPKYNDVSVAKLINSIMKDGKKSVAESIVYSAFGLVEERTQDDPLKVFKRALENVKPVLEVRSRRVGGATYQVPVEVRHDRRLALAIRWMVTYAAGRPGKAMFERLAAEIMDASNRKGSSVKKREDVHKMADANKAFAHYRW